MPLEFFIFICLIILAKIAGRILDEHRIDNHFEEAKGKVISKNEKLFGTGWLGDKNRIYDVEFEDKEGNVKKTTVKTSLLSGVYQTNEKIIKASQKENLRIENERLKKELQELKQAKKRRRLFF